MLTIVLAMLAIVIIAAVVVAYVAFPHRGETLPAAPWLGRAMTRGVEAMPPTLDEESVHD